MPIGSVDYPTPARRPGFSVLDKSSLIRALDVTPSHWRQELRFVLSEFERA
ncbi:MAG: sugar nucleotide-binding protein [Gammaproteobacteria bacterium]